MFSNSGVCDLPGSQRQSHVLIPFDVPTGLIRRGTSRSSQPINERFSLVKFRKKLLKPNILGRIWGCFRLVPRPCRKSRYEVTDHLMSAFVALQQKFSSLLGFDEATRSRKRKGMSRRTRANLRKLYRIKRVPSDSGLRKFLDRINPIHLRSAFLELFRMLQRNGVLKRYWWEDKHYLVSIDGTGVFSSNHLHCEHCCQKQHENGAITYYHQAVGAAVVHPDQSEVIPLAPEPISKQLIGSEADPEVGPKDEELTDFPYRYTDRYRWESSNKWLINDCESRAIRRLVTRLHREHPRLKIVVLADGLHSNATFIKLLKRYRMSFIIVARPSNHEHLFELFVKADETGESHRLVCWDKAGVKYTYIWVNQQPLNQANPELKINFLWCEIEAPGEKPAIFSWVTDWEINDSNVQKIAQAGRSRWQIEDTFNSLKNRGYQLEHNYGHGKEHLSTVFLFLMMLAVLVDQMELIACTLFKRAPQMIGSLQEVWIEIRCHLRMHCLTDWNHLYQLLVYGMLDFVPKPAAPT